MLPERRDASEKNGEKLAKTAELARDSVSLGHWSTELAAISAAEVASVKAGRWQASVATPVAEGGAIRGQINPGKTD